MSLWTGERRNWKPSAGSIPAAGRVVVAAWWHPASCNRREGSTLKASDQVRALVAEHMVPAAPLAVALLAVADGLDVQERGTAALTERLERLEEDREAERPYSGGVHVLGHMGDSAA